MGCGFVFCQKSGYDFSFASGAGHIGQSNVNVKLAKETMTVVREGIKLLSGEVKAVVKLVCEQVDKHKNRPSQVPPKTLLLTTVNSHLVALIHLSVCEI